VFRRAERLSSGTCARPPLVLLVDAAADERAECAHVLAHEGFLVVEAGDGRQAIAQARALDPDIIVMDPLLPMLDGFAVVRVLATYESTSSIPVLALAGRASLVEMEGLGFADFIVKPCAPRAVAACVRAVLARWTGGEVHRMGRGGR
jgi:DNA-binding response OmpR family regulator